ncbi:MAG: helix-turn-helix domain-containing protein [Propionibacteriaceae bacterium]|nr:helix-turn-helix domain-containing protein [Propionibacteriaceae bacterium]
MPPREDTGSPLGAFLKARRASVTPDQVGLAAGLGPRRTPGLRREELATLAGISNDYYIRLERGKERRPSPLVIESLATALRLNDAERDHLRDLARQVDRTDAADNVVITSDVPIGVVRILQALRPYPAFVTNRIGDYVAWNPSGLRLLAGLSDWPAERRNAARYGFLHPAARALFSDWENQVAGLVSGLRRLTSTEPNAADVATLVNELRQASPDFQRLWDRYDIDLYATGSQTLHHPEIGELTIEYQVLRIEGGSGLTMMTYHAEPDSPEYDAFTKLDA